MAITQETIARFQQAPHLIGRLRREVVHNPHVNDVRSEADRIIAEEGFQLTPGHLQLVDSAIPLLERNLNGARFIARAYASDKDSTTARIAEGLEVSSDAITEVNMHPSSITVALQKDAFVSHWKRDEPRKQKTPAAYLMYDDRLKLDEYVVAFSRRNAATSGVSSAKHENTHWEYMYTHPRFFPNEQQKRWTAELEAEDLKAYTKIAKDAFKENDFGRFRRHLGQLAFIQMYDFLNELTARAPDGWTAASEFSNPDKRTFFEARIIALRKGLPRAFAERLPWERMIWETLETLEHQMYFVENEYLSLQKGGMDGEILRDSLQTLRPGSAFMIKALNPKNPTTPEDAKKWRDESAHRLPKNDSDRKIEDWVRFLRETVDVRSDYLGNCTEYFLYNIKVRQNQLAHQIDGESKEPSLKPDQFARQQKIVTELMEFSASIRAIALLETFDILIKENSLSEQEEQSIRLGLTKQLLRSDAFYFRLLAIYSYNKADFNHPEFDRLRLTSPKKIEEYEAETRANLVSMVERGLEIDDATDEIVRIVSSSQIPDVKSFFAPGFRKTDEEYLLLLHAFTSTQKDLPYDLSPLERRALAHARYHLNGIFSKDLFDYDQFGIRSWAVTVGEGWAASLAMRLVRFATENRIDDERTQKINGYLLERYNDHRIPREYHPYLQEKLGFPEEPAFDPLEGVEIGPENLITK